MKGAPWVLPHWLENPLPVAKAKPKPGSLSYAPEITTGPPIRGAPWTQRLEHEPSGNLTAPPAPKIIIPQVYAPEIFQGPGKGAPWNTHILQEPSGKTIKIIVPPPIRPAKGILSLPTRDPRMDPRLRRFTEIVSQMVNSLLRHNQLVETSPGEWEIVGGGGIVANRDPGPTDNAALGTIWINTVTGNAFILVSTGPAVWDMIGGSSGSGLTGTFP